MNLSDPLQLSVILLTPDNFETIRPTVRHLRAQTVREKLELIIITPSRAGLQLDDAAVAGFGAVRIVEVGPIWSASPAKATALSHATAPWVVLAEDHCYPDPNWAETLLAAHAAGHTIVGPVIDNANPTSALSWANFIACFGRWTGPMATATATQTPYHNTSYRRDLLQPYGTALPGLLAIEHFLQEDLQKAGHQPHLTAATRARHINFSRFRPWVIHAYLGGRLFGGTRWRWERWPAWKRLLYFCGSPLIPCVRFYRTTQQMKSDPRQWERRWGIWPWLFLGFVVHAIGEMVGYLLGPDGIELLYSRLESRRTDNVTAHDRTQLAAAG